MPSTVVLETDFDHWPCRRGKVRDVYDLGTELLLVSTDRISAFDWVLPTGIPDKGRVLTQISAFWFESLGVTNHLITSDVDQMSLPDSVDRDSLRGRTMLVRKTSVFPIECVVRGYLSGRLEGVPATTNGLWNCFAAEPTASGPPRDSGVYSGNQGRGRP